MYVVVFHTFRYVRIIVCSPCWWVLNSAAGTELHTKSLTVGGWVTKSLVSCTQFKITFPTYGSYVTIRTFFFSNFAHFLYELYRSWIEVHTK